MKKIILSILVGGLLLVSFFFMYKYPEMFNITDESVEVIPVVDDTSLVLPDVLNAEYTVEGETFLLKNGKAKKEIMLNPNSSMVTENTLEVLGVPIFDDFDGDGDMDGVLWLVNDSGGSGKFYYAVFAMNINGQVKSTNTLFIGDRILPQSLDFQNGEAVYSFLEREANAPMASEPTIGRTLWVIYNKDTGEISKKDTTASGATGTAKTKINTKVWHWVSLIYNDGKKIVPNVPEKFALAFKDDGTFSASTDCNGIGGSYTVKDNQITFSNMLGTLMYCEGSQEDDFKKMLEQTQSFFFNEKQEMIFNLKFDSGSAVFR